MTPRDYFKLAVSHKLHLKRDWLISVMTESHDVAKYPYGLNSSADGVMSYQDPEHGPVTIEGNFKGRPLFDKGERVSWDYGDIPTVKSKVDTTYRETIINLVVFGYALGEKWTFMPGRLDYGKIEKSFMVPRLVSDPLPDEPPVPEDKISVAEYIKVTEALGFMRDFVSFMAPAASPKTMVVSDDIIAYRDKRLAEDPEIATDLTKLAQLEGELTKMDYDDMMTDSSAGFFVNPGKTINVARKKLHLMIGHDSGFAGEGGSSSTITTSLNEGIRVEDFPALNNGMRSGSYSRGKETELGGEGVKLMNGVFQNTRIVEEDCGSKVGLNWTITEDAIPYLVGSYTITDVKTSLTKESLEANIGKVLTLRTPLGCRTKPPSHCRVCIGERYGGSPQGLTSAAANILSNIMGIFMSAFHAKELKLSKLDLKTALT